MASRIHDVLQGSNRISERKIVPIVVLKFDTNSTPRG